MCRLNSSIEIIYIPIRLLSKIRLLAKSRKLEWVICKHDNMIARFIVTRGNSVSPSCRKLPSFKEQRSLQEGWRLQKHICGGITRMI